MPSFRICAYVAINLLCPMTLPLAPLTKRLRSVTGEPRVALARQNGKLKLRGTLSNGLTVFRNLDATDELTALDCAIDMTTACWRVRTPAHGFHPLGTSSATCGMRWKRSNRRGCGVDRSGHQP